MAADHPQPAPLNTSQVTTHDLTETPATAGISEPNADTLYAPEGPEPAGTRSDAPQRMADQAAAIEAHPEQGAGVQGEEVIWESRYVMKNFLGRLATRFLMTVAWIAFSIYAWEYSPSQPLRTLAAILGVVLLIVWAHLIYRILLARFGHYYRLTTRRLFVSTGLMRRRRDQLELLRVKDVFTKQMLTERWMKLGTVVVVPDDRQLPTFYILGISDPKQVMDLIWHHARSEREGKSVQVENV